LHFIEKEEGRSALSEHQRGMHCPKEDGIKEEDSRFGVRNTDRAAGNRLSLPSERLAA